MDSKQLSGREIEVLKLIAQGKSNKEIAAELFISVNTVRVHLKHIFQKIDVASRTEAALYAMDLGIVQFPTEPVKSEINLVSEFYMPTEAETNRWKQLWNKFWWAIVLLAIASFTGLSALLAKTPLFVSPTTIGEPLLSAANEQRWQELAPLPQARANMASVAYDNDIYVIGGETDSGITSLVERYDPETDNWIKQKEKPTAVKDISAVMIGEKIFIPGGLTTEGRPTNFLEVFDPRKNSWERKANVPIAVSAYALTSFEGQMYLFGGWDGEKVLDSVFRYDPSNDRWNKAITMSSARASAGAAVVGGKIYIVGGWNGMEYVNLNESFNPSRESTEVGGWKTEPAVPVSAKQLIINSIGDSLFVVSKNVAGDSILMQFSQIEKSWTTLIEGFPYTIGNNVSASSIDGSLYLIGGENDENEYLPNNLRCQVIFSTFIPNISK